MNAMEWLKSVRENPQKSPVPLMPPERGLQKTSGNIGIPPVPPCNPKHFVENQNNSPATKPQQREIYWGDEPEPGSSGGDRGNQGFFTGNEVLPHEGGRGKQEKTTVLETSPPTEAPMPPPFLTADGTLSIPFDSDPKYHWWQGGQSVASTRAEVLARMEAQRAGQDGGARVG